MSLLYTIKFIVSSKIIKLLIDKVNATGSIFFARFIMKLSFLPSKGEYHEN